MRSLVGLQCVQPISRCPLLSASKGEKTNSKAFKIKVSFFYNKISKLFIASKENGLGQRGEAYREGEAKVWLEINFRIEI